MIWYVVTFAAGFILACIGLDRYYKNKAHEAIAQALIETALRHEAEANWRKMQSLN